MDKEQLGEDRILLLHEEARWERRKHLVATNAEGRCRLQPWAQRPQIEFSWQDGSVRKLGAPVTYSFLTATTGLENVYEVPETGSARQSSLLVEQSNRCFE